MATTGDSGQSTCYETTIHRQARTELHRVPERTRDELVAKVKGAACRRQPTEHPDVKVLRNYDMFRVRAGRHRALCTLQQPEVRVLLVDHRDKVYDRQAEAAARM